MSAPPLLLVDAAGEWFWRWEDEGVLMGNLVLAGFAAASMSLACMAPEAGAQQSDFAPRVSPDGNWLVYYSYRNDAAPDLFLMDLQTGVERALTETPEVWEVEAHWSWDGQYVLFGAGSGMPDLRPAFLQLSDGRPTGPVQRMDTAPVGMKRVTAVEPGVSVLYVQEYGLPVRQRFSVYREGEGAMPWLDSMPDGEFAAPFLSPDRRFLVAIRELDGQTDLVRVEYASGEVTALTGTPDEEAYLAWSAGGRWLTWSQSDAFDGRQIFGMQLDTAGNALHAAEQLTAGEAGQVHFFSSVSDDGAWLYYDVSTPQGFELRRRSLTDRDAPHTVLTQRALPARE